MGRKLLVLLLGVMISMFGIHLYGALRWTPLQNRYFDQYLSSVAYSGKGGYSLLYVRYPNGWRRAVNSDVVNARQNPQSARLGTFALSDQARRAGADALEWKYLPEVENATAAQW